jgi:uncharacterized iron-regulated protein
MSGFGFRCKERVARTVAAACVICAAVFAAPLWAASRSGLYDGATGQAVSLERALAAVGPGYIVIVSEQHNVEVHHIDQLAVVQVLRRLGLPVSVGFEFFAYPDQPGLDRYVRGEVEENEFLQAVGWAGDTFEWYRPLVLAPRDANGRARALNAPRQLARSLAQKGLEGLSDDERAWLPPNFQLGNPLYFERFAVGVRQHGPLPERAVQNFFAAQSAWDDTMAWQAVDYLRVYPEQILVIIVGDFHAAYGGGLPARLRERGATHVLVISQVNAFQLREADWETLLAPDPRYGVRADFIWLTR